MLPSRRTVSILSTMLLFAEEYMREVSQKPTPCENTPRSVRRRCGTTVFSTSPYRARTPRELGWH
jgi:hypothetical protein